MQNKEVDKEHDTVLIYFSKLKIIFQVKLDTLSQLNVTELSYLIIFLTCLHFLLQNIEILS